MSNYCSACLFYCLWIQSIAQVKLDQNLAQLGLVPANSDWFLRTQIVYRNITHKTGLYYSVVAVCILVGLLWVDSSASTPLHLDSTHSKRGQQNMTACSWGTLAFVTEHLRVCSKMTLRWSMVLKYCLLRTQAFYFQLYLKASSCKRICIWTIDALLDTFTECWCNGVFTYIKKFTITNLEVHTPQRTRTQSEFCETWNDTNELKLILANSNYGSIHFTKQILATAL